MHSRIQTVITWMQADSVNKGSRRTVRSRGMEWPLTEVLTAKFPSTDIKCFWYNWVRQTVLERSCSWSSPFSIKSSGKKCFSTIVLDYNNDEFDKSISFLPAPKMLTATSSHPLVRSFPKKVSACSCRRHPHHAAPPQPLSIIDPERHKKSPTMRDGLGEKAEAGRIDLAAVAAIITPTY